MGIDYKLAPGLTPYAEISYYRQEGGHSSANDNDGHVFLVGSQLNF